MILVFKVSQVGKDSEMLFSTLAGATSKLQKVARHYDAIMGYKPILKSDGTILQVFKAGRKEPLEWEIWTERVYT